MSRTTELDGLRAVATLLVIGCHYAAFSELAHGIPSFGWVSVNIFFVLSGYLITTILLGLRSRKHPYKTFYIRRAFRILPPYLLTVFAICLLAILAHHPAFLSGNFFRDQLLFLQAYQHGTVRFLVDHATHPRYYLQHLPNLTSGAHVATVSKGLPPEFPNVKAPFWSLSVEEYFYMFWAPIILHFSRKSTIAIALAFCFVEPLLRWMDSTYISYFNLFYNMDTPMYGAFLALFLARRRKGTVPDSAERFLLVLFCVAAGLIGGILYLQRPVVGFEIRTSPVIAVFVLPLIAISAASLIGLIVLRSNSGWWLGRVLRSTPLVYLGTISYTVYLIHMLVYVLIAHAFGNQNMITAAAATLFAIVVARASWHWVEKPLLRLKDARFPNAPHPQEPALS